MLKDGTCDQRLLENSLLTVSRALHAHWGKPAILLVDEYDVPLARAEQVGYYDEMVGFIRNLPHHLIHAFRSTLDEAVYADLLLIVIDASDPEAAAQLAVTEELLESLGAGGKPTLYVFNKCDLGAATPGLVRERGECVYISAATGQGVDLLLARIEEMLHAGKRRVTFLIPNAKQGLLNKLYENATVEAVDYGAEGVTVTAVVDDKTYGPLKQYDTDPKKESADEW